MSSEGPVFWNQLPCNLVHRDIITTLNGVTSQVTIIFTVTAIGVTWLITVGGGGGGGGGGREGGREQQN
jgi:hypothetical protein